MFVAEACVFLGCLEPGSWTELIGSVITFLSVGGGLVAFFLKVRSDKKIQARRLVTATVVDRTDRSEDRTVNQVRIVVENTSDQSFYQPQYVQHKFTRTWLTWIPSRRRSAIYMTSSLRPQGEGSKVVLDTLVPGAKFEITTSIDDVDENRMLLIFADANGNVWTRNLRTKSTKPFSPNDAASFGVFRDPMRDMAV